ncbi:MAG: hypothetical protein CL853_03310 [Crocinitomicaceae bacterium]|nr:hypothetical protein [Crocinitomicaceae bacterium]
MLNTIDGLEKENMINKMKNIVLLISLFVLSIVSAQDCVIQKEPNWGSDSASCRTNVSLYTEFLKQKNWTDASSSWWKAQESCPKYKTNLYKNGTYIYRKITSERAKAKDPNIGLYVDTLFKIYDLWISNYGNCNEIKLKSAGDIMKFVPKSKYETAYGLFQEVYANNSGALSYGDIKLFFYSAIYMFNNKKIDCDAFLTDFEQMSDLCDKNIKSGIKVDKFKAVISFLDQSIAPCASCDKLEEIYSKKVAANPDDMNLTRKVFGMLSAKKCTDSDFYLALLEKVLNDPDNPPTDKDLINAALADHKRGDYAKAKERFNRALEISQDEENKQKCYTMLYDIALKRKNYKEAFRLTSSMTDNCIANERKARAVAASASDCGTSALERSLVYCLALDYADKACGKVGSATVNAWKGSLLPKKDLIMLDVVNGSEHTVKCWNSTVKLRTRD